MDAIPLMYGAWAVGTLTVWGKVVVDDWHQYKSPTDRRDTLGDLVSDFALLLSSVAAAVSLVTLIVGHDLPGIQGFVLATFLGGFLAAGIVKLTLRRRGR